MRALGGGGEEEKQREASGVNKWCVKVSVLNMFSYAQDFRTDVLDRQNCRAKRSRQEDKCRKKLLPHVLLQKIGINRNKKEHL